MEFNVTLEIGLGLGNISIIAHSIANGLNENLKNTNFGNSVKQIIVSIVCVAPEFETFFKSRKPKFVSGRKTIKKHGTEYEIDSLLTYDLKLNFEKIKSMNDNEIKIYIEEELINSISVIKTFTFEDFDINNFEKEIRNFALMDG